MLVLHGRISDSSLLVLQVVEQSPPPSAPGKHRVVGIGNKLLRLHKQMLIHTWRGLGIWFINCRNRLVLSPQDHSSGSVLLLLWREAKSTPQASTNDEFIIVV